MQKNDVVKVTIEDIGVNGEGIGKIDGYTLFIKDAVIGDVVEAKIMKAKKNYGYARMIQIIEPSKDRVEPKCKFARQCGGCQIQQIPMRSSWSLKTEKCWEIWRGSAAFRQNCWKKLQIRSWEWKSHFTTEIRRSSRLEKIKME